MYNSINPARKSFKATATNDSYIDAKSTVISVLRAAPDKNVRYGSGSGSVHRRLKLRPPGSHPYK
jgi:hypothetical protein